MKIALLAAMDKEVALLENILQDRAEEIADGMRVSTGNVGHHTVVLAKCGIGKVNAALTALRVIKAFGPDLVINSGVAGGAGRSRIGDLVVATGVAYHDVWCGPGTAWGAADGFEAVIEPSPRVESVAREYLAGPATVFGVVATGDIFVSKVEEVSRIRACVPDTVAVDMESAAIGQTCTACGVPFAVLRVVSDTPGEGENISQYKDFWQRAPETTFRALSLLLQHL